MWRYFVSGHFSSCWYQESSQFFFAVGSRAQPRSIFLLSKKVNILHTDRRGEGVRVNEKLQYRLTYPMRVETDTRQQATEMRMQVHIPETWFNCLDFFKELFRTFGHFYRGYFLMIITEYCAYTTEFRTFGFSMQLLF